jgi:hypothetical protein
MNIEETIKDTLYNIIKDVDVKFIDTYEQRQKTKNFAYIEIGDMAGEILQMESYRGGGYYGGCEAYIVLGNIAEKNKNITDENLKIIGDIYQEVLVKLFTAKFDNVLNLKFGTKEIEFQIENIKEFAKTGAIIDNSIQYSLYLLLSYSINIIKI